MRLYSLKLFYKNLFFFFEPISGSLLFNYKGPSSVAATQEMPSKLQIALELCNNPFQLKKTWNTNFDLSQGKKRFLRIFGMTLVEVCKRSFYLGRIISKFGYPLFDSSKEAIAFFNKIYPPEVQNELCYPRTLFAASVSKKFRKDGVIFIGVFLPSRLMHAWIIEDGVQPDMNDNMWINFRPVALLY